MTSPLQAFRVSPLEIQSFQAQPEPLAVIAANLGLTRWISAVSLTVLLYDSLLTFDDEIKWLKRPSFLKLASVVIRVIALIILTLNGWPLAALYRDITDLYCTAVLGAIGPGALLAFAFCNWIYMTRVKVLFGNNKIINVCLTVSWFIVYITNTALVIATNIALEGKMLYSPFMTACGIIGRPKVMGFVWVGPLIFESVIFAMTIGRIYYQRSQETFSLGSRLIRVLYRDGICYYLVVLALRIYVFLSWIILPISSTLIGIFLLWSFMLVAVNRMQLNLMNAAYPSETTGIGLTDLSSMRAESGKIPGSATLTNDPIPESFLDPLTTQGSVRFSWWSRPTSYEGRPISKGAV